MLKRFGSNIFIPGFRCNLEILMHSFILITGESSLATGGINSDLARSAERLKCLIQVISQLN
mgnify:CR=1